MNDLVSGCWVPLHVSTSLHPLHFIEIIFPLKIPFKFGVWEEWQRSKVQLQLNSQGYHNKVNIYT